MVVYSLGDCRIISFGIFLPLTFPRSCCSSDWTSISLVFSSSLVAWAESVIASGFSGFLPFLKGGAAGGVPDDIALWPSTQDQPRVLSGAKKEESYPLLLLSASITIGSGPNLPHAWAFLERRETQTHTESL